MRDAGTECHGRRTGAESPVMLHGVSGDRRLVHHLVDLVAGVVTAANVQSVQVELVRRRVIDRLSEEALLDQPCDLGAANDRVEGIGQTLAIQPLRCGSETEHDRLRKCREYLRPGASGGVVALVHDDDIRRHEASDSTNDSLDGNDLDMRQRIDRPASGDDAMRDSELAHRPARLLDQLLPVDENPDAFALGSSAVRDVAEHDRLARAGRTDNKRAALALLE